MRLDVEENRYVRRPSFAHLQKGKYYHVLDRWFSDSTLPTYCSCLSRLLMSGSF